MPQRILVTGSGGFMGRALTTALRADAHDVFAMTRAHGDIVEPKTFASLDIGPVDIVFHLAGKTDVAQSWKRPGDYYSVNVMGTQRALEFCREKGAKFLYLGTYVYGAPRYLPVDEQHPVNPANPYTHSKWLGEELCRFYASRYDMPSICVRMFNIYGPGQSEHFLVPHLLQELRRGESVRVRSLAPRRDMLYIDDALDALRRMCQSSHTGVYNLGYGASWSVAEIVATLQDLLKTSLPVRQEGELPPHEVMDIVADTRRVCEDFQWRPRHDLRAGLKRVITETAYGHQI